MLANLVGLFLIRNTLDTIELIFIFLGRASDNPEAAEMLASLRSTVAFQAKDMEDLRAQIVAMEAEVSRLCFTRIASILTFII